MTDRGYCKQPHPSQKHLNNRPFIYKFDWKILRLAIVLMRPAQIDLSYELYSIIALLFLSLVGTCHGRE